MRGGEHRGSEVIDKILVKPGFEMARRHLLVGGSIECRTRHQKGI